MLFTFFSSQITYFFCIYWYYWKIAWVETCWHLREINGDMVIRVCIFLDDVMVRMISMDGRIVCMGDTTMGISRTFVVMDYRTT